MAIEGTGSRRVRDGMLWARVARAVVRQLGGVAQITGQMALDTRRRSTWSRPTKVVPALDMARDSHAELSPVH
ncbi:hypothetical protein GCM10009738_88880 [Kitasatospora viridis]